MKYFTKISGAFFLSFIHKLIDMFTTNIMQVDLEGINFTVSSSILILIYYDLY